MDGYLGRIDGILLLAGLAVFLTIGIITARRSDPKEASVPAPKKTLLFIFLILVGMLGLLVGAKLMVSSAIFFANQFGLSEVFIGLSIVAVGTSLPELATSVVAGARGEHDISIGNVVGSNIFNICLVIGTVGLFNPMPVDMGLTRFEFPAMLFLSVLVFIFARTNYTINRLEGLVFILGFILFIGVSFWMSN
jgi:cation:H+ antiporter